MRPGHTDRRIKRTTHALHVALNTLVLEKGYAAVSVKDITDRADVGRSTFYEHHGSKRGLLLHGLEHLRAALAEAPSTEAIRSDPLRSTRLFFSHVSGYRELFKAVSTGSDGDGVTGKMKRILGDAIRRDLHDVPGAMILKMPPDLLVQFAVDTAFSLLSWWLDRRPRLSAEAIDEIYRQLVEPAFQSPPRSPPV